MTGSRVWKLSPERVAGVVEAVPVLLDHGLVRGRVASAFLMTASEGLRPFPPEITRAGSDGSAKKRMKRRVNPADEGGTMSEMRRRTMKTAMAKSNQERGGHHQVPTPLGVGVSPSCRSSPTARCRAAAGELTIVSRNTWSPVYQFSGMALTVPLSSCSSDCWEHSLLGGVGLLEGVRQEFLELRIVVTPEVVAVDGHRTEEVDHEVAVGRGSRRTSRIDRSGRRLPWR